MLSKEKPSLTHADDASEASASYFRSGPGMPAGDEIDFVLLGRKLLQKKVFILGGTLVVSVVTAIASLLRPNVYESKGFLNAEMPTSVYNKGLPTLTDCNRFLAFLKGSADFPLEKFPGMDKALSKSDSRMLGRMLQVVYDSPGGAPSPNVIGFWVTASDRIPENAQLLAVAYGKYIVDSLLRDTLYDYINTHYLELLKDQAKVEEDGYNSRIRAQLLATKREDVRKISSNYASVPVAVNQVFRMKGETDQYQSPLSEMVRLELDIADTKMQEAQLKKKSEMDSVELGFFSKAKDLLSVKDIRGDKLLDELSGLREHYFEDRRLPRESAHQAGIAIGSFLEQARVTYASTASKVTFTLWPSVPQQHASPHRSKIVITAFLLSLVGLSGIELVRSGLD